MRRLFWMGAGAAAGVYVVRKVQKTARAYSPTPLAHRAGGFGASVRYFADGVRAGMLERELDLRDALGIGTHRAYDDARHDTAYDDERDDVAYDDASDHLPPAEAARLIEHPTRHRRSAG